MDSASPNQQSIEPQGIVLRHGNGKKGIFEILLIVFLLIITLVLLNYLNILPLSKMFPNQLELLPHRSNEKPTQSGNSTIAPTAILASSIAEKDKKTLNNFLPTVIVSSLVPDSSSDITFVQGKTTQDEYLAAWQTQDGKGAVRFSMSPSTKQIAEIHILFDYITNKPVSKDLAKATVSLFFSQTPKKEFSCKTLSSNYNYCESFWEESDGAKRGVGIQENGPSPSNTVSVFFCQFTTKSKDYSWKSCNAEL